MKKLFAAALIAVAAPVFATEAVKPAAEAKPAADAKKETKKEAKKDAKATTEHHDEAAPAAGHK